MYTQILWLARAFFGWRCCYTTRHVKGPWKVWGFFCWYCEVQYNCTWFFLSYNKAGFPHHVTSRGMNKESCCPFERGEREHMTFCSTYELMTMISLCCKIWSQRRHMRLARPSYYNAGWIRVLISVSVRSGKGDIEKNGGRV